MIILFDTSVLIASFIASHPRHNQALSWLKKVKGKEYSWVVSGHSVAECYAVLTRLPLTPKLTPAMAKQLIEENIEGKAKIISLTSTEYLSVVEEVANLGLCGGVIYDAITLKAAQKAKAQKILTFNLRDFHRLSPKKTDHIVSP